MSSLQPADSYTFYFAESVYFRRFAKLQCLFFGLILQFWSFLVKLSANKTTNILLIQIFPFFQIGWNLSLLLTHWYWHLFVSDVRYSSRSALMSAETKNKMNMYRYNRGPGRRNNIVILVSDELENLFTHKKELLDFKLSTFYFFPRLNSFVTRRSLIGG